MSWENMFNDSQLVKYGKKECSLLIQRMCVDIFPYNCRQMRAFMSQLEVMNLFEIAGCGQPAIVCCGPST